MTKIIINFNLQHAEDVTVDAVSIEDAQHKLNIYGLPDNKVFLLSIETNDTPYTDEILVTESLPIMRSFLECFDDNVAYGGAMIIHLQEYDTYEDAYAVALDMREPNPLCYN